MFNLLLWIFVYSFCLVHITLFAVIYLKHKNKTELSYLVVLANMFLVTIMVMLLIMFDANNFYHILLNCLLSLYVTVPLYVYNLFGVNKKHYKLIPILVATEAVIENVLMVHGIYGGIFASRIVFYVLLLVPVFVNKKTKPKKGSLEWNIRNMTAKTAVMLVAFIIIHIPFSLFIFEIPYVSSLFWATFTLAYQIPGLLYCKKRLLEKPALFGKTGISSLTKRENEVALAICKGDKYEEIAQKLFISLSAVKKHSYHIYRKLGINNNRELMHLFMESQKENDVTI